MFPSRNDGKISKSAQRRLFLITLLSELDGSTSNGLVCALQTTLTRLRRWRSLFPHPFKGKLSNSSLGCAAQKENKQELAQMPAQSQSDA